MSEKVVQRLMKQESLVVAKPKRRRYFNDTELKACEDAGITTYVPKPMTSGAKAEGRFDKSNFVYIAQRDEYGRVRRSIQ